MLRVVVSRAGAVARASVSRATASLSTHSHPGSSGGGPLDNKERAAERAWTNAHDAELLAAMREKLAAMRAAEAKGPAAAPAAPAAAAPAAHAELHEILGGSATPSVISRLLAWRDRR